MAKKNGVQNENTAAEAEKFKNEAEKLRAEAEKLKLETEETDGKTADEPNAQSVSAAYRDGAAEAVLKFLPVADNFGYAYDSASDEKTKTGIDKVIKSFATVLRSLGIEEIKISAGDPFDESVAEAVMNCPCAEGETPNTVKQVIKKGYRADGKVIRFAQVLVTV